MIKKSFNYMGRVSLQTEHTQHLRQSAVNISGIISTFSPICHLHKMNKCVTSVMPQMLLEHL